MKPTVPVMKLVLVMSGAIQSYIVSLLLPKLSYRQ